MPPALDPSAGGSGPGFGGLTASLCSSGLLPPQVPPAVDFVAGGSGPGSGGLLASFFATPLGSHPPQAQAAAASAAGHAHGNDFCSPLEIVIVSPLSLLNLPLLFP